MERLRGLRTALLLVNVTLACSIMLAIIKDKQPEILKNFKYSDVSDQVILISELTDLC